MKARTVSLLVVSAAIVAGGAYGWNWYSTGIQPMPAGKTKYIRWDQPARIRNVLNDLKAKKIVRNVDAARFYGWLNKKPALVQVGTYELAAGMSLEEIFRELQKPVRQMVRIPETNWAKRTASILEKNAICKSDEYMSLVNKPEEFKGVVDFPLPAKSLEGYLYPDTYDLPPLLGAKATITRQLKAFQKKIWD